MYSDFLKEVRTNPERMTLLGEIDILINSTYEIKAGAMEESLNKKIRAETVELFRKAQKTETNFLGFLKALRQIILDLKEIDITISLDPTEDLVEELHSWLERNLEKSLVINFQKDESLIGGAQISYLGKYFELSARKTLNELIDQKHLASLPGQV